MADSFIQLPPDSTGKLIDTSSLTVGANTVQRERDVIADPTNAAGLAAVENASPGATDFGLVVRPVNGALETGGNLAAIKADTDKIPSQGQALAAASMPVVLTAIQAASLAAPVVSGSVGLVPATSGGLLAAVSQALTSSINIKNAAGQVYGFDWYNPNNVTVYIFLYNTTTVPGTIGSTSNLIFQKGLPAGSGCNVSFPVPIAFGTGIAIAVSTSPTSSSAPGTGLVLTTLYD